ncbi:MAG: hypothetical protein K0Q90_429 [Paenibacillaceae bacterium]|jgi:diguanylate cyclase (GGDEF)-like protein/PAS domain S-box-containing protein|nr:hypothetical protein [Paenibacillaceae bacterium]
MSGIGSYRLMESFVDNYKKSVCRCMDSATGRPVILKILKPDGATPVEVLRFKKEFQLLQELATGVQGIRRPLELLEQAGSYVMVLEDASGQTLKSVIAQGLPDIHDVLDMMMQLVDTLGAIHEHHIIHKDIKPSNIIWDSTGKTVKLIDFGHSVKLSGGMKDYSSQGLLEGSLLYISPEQTGRMNRNMDYRTDYYSLGAVLYELATGSKPYECRDTLEQIYSILAKEPVPPHELAAGRVPEELSGIIMKLLKKSPEDRYQSPYGIKADLLKCRTGQTGFVLGQEDRQNRFRIPGRVYGREKELAHLEEVYQHCAAGSSRMVLVSGEAGSGKTALIRSLQMAATREKGLFAEGKCDQFNRSIPYGCMVEVLRGLMDQRLALSAGEDLSGLRDSLRSALKENGSLIAGLVPELEQWLGPFLPVQPLNPAEETSRFHITVASFLSALALEDRPLVIFLDDIQWADVSMLELAEYVVTDHQLSHCLIVCTCRDQETAPGHPVFPLVRRLTELGTGVHIPLGPLAPEAVCSLIAATLHIPPVQAAGLAELVQGRTGGNAMFVREMLDSLYRNGHIFFDDRSGTWDWDKQAIGQLPISDGLVAFLMTRLSALPGPVRGLLKLAAAIGGSFDLRLLSLAAGQDLRQIIPVLLQAVGEEMVAPLDNLQFEAASLLLQEQDIRFLGQMRFRFRHDRLQQAFYDMLSQQEKEQLHWALGKLLAEHLSPKEAGEKIAEAAEHVNKGLRCATEQADIRLAAELNWKAAQKSRSVLAYEAAFGFLQILVEQLLPLQEGMNASRHGCRIRKLYAECSFMTRRIGLAQDICRYLLEHTADSLEAAQIFELQTSHYFYLGMMAEAIQAGRNGLDRLGLRLPHKASMAAVLNEMLAVKRNLRKTGLADLSALPDMSDGKIRLMMRLLVNMFPPAFISGESALFGLLVLKKVRLTLTHGTSPESALAFIGYAMLLSGLGEMKQASEFGQLGLRIMAKANDPQWQGAVLVLHTLFCYSWDEPWETLESRYKLAIDANLRTGNLLYLAHACFYVNLWNPTLDVQGQLREAEAYLPVIVNTRYKEALATAHLSRQLWRNLAGELENPLSLDGSGFSEADYLREQEKAGYYSGIAIYYVYKLRLCYLYNDSQGALQLLDKAYGTAGTLAGSAFMEEFALYAFLNQAAAYPTLTLAQKTKARFRMSRELRRMSKWAAHNPGNFSLQLLLMKAEEARISGKEQTAGHYYNLAVEASAKSPFIRYKALIHERAAVFYEALEHHDYAMHLRQLALYYYSVWGAKEKCRQLQEHYPGLAAGGPEARQPYARGTLTHTTQSMDLDFILAASQSISKEIELDLLLKRLMELVIKNAGAQKGTIITSPERGLAVSGKYLPEEDRIEVAMLSRPHALLDLPQSIVDQVDSSQNGLVYHDLALETTFVNDPYIVRNRPKSAVCMPLVSQNKTVAVIYLENNLMTGAFTQERMRVIHLLSREMVISLENAGLYTDLEQSEEKYRQLIDNMMDGIYIIQDGLLQYANAALEQMMGYGPGEINGHSFEEYIVPRDRKKVTRHYRARLTGLPAPGEYEMVLQHKDGVREIIILHKGTPISYMGKPAVQGTIKDITQRKHAEQELREHKDHLEELVRERTWELEEKNAELNRYIALIEKISITDELTGLYNRRHFNRIFAGLVDEKAASKDCLALMILDVDYYKKYNDHYGHYEGDRALQQIGIVLLETAASIKGTAFRLGGEEFGLLLPGCHTEDAAAYAESIRSAIADMEIEHAQSPAYKVITVSIGVAAVRVDGLNEEGIYKLADDALYHSKTNGRNCITLVER